MKLIIPMAGRGTRVRPHSHVTPKPLLHVCGKSMVQRIVETFAEVLPRPITEAVFVLGPDFGDDVRRDLAAICQPHGIAAHFAVQPKAEGTAHAVLMAGDHLASEGVIVFADTLFYMPKDASVFDGADCVAWTKTVDDPRRFGVAVREGDRVTAFVEKPSEPISNEALIGIYWVKELADMRRECQRLMDEGRAVKGEYQLTDAMDALLKQGKVFKTAGVTDWLDCGTIPALLETTQDIIGREPTLDAQGTNSVFVQPVYIGPGATITNAVVGPHASIEAGATVTGSTVARSIVFAKARVEASHLDGALVGQQAMVKDFAGKLNIGDHASVGVVQ